jgi:hypothetical protein
MLTLSASASDNVGVGTVEFEVDGSSVGNAASAPYVVAVATDLYASGQHVVRARARDATGNLSAWSSATVQFGGSRSAPAGFTRNASWITGLDNAVRWPSRPTAGSGLRSRAGRCGSSATARCWRRRSCS